MVDSHILCRMRAVHAAYEANAVKYQSAGRGRKAARVQKVLRVLRFDAPIARGLWYAPSKKKGAVMIKPYNRTLGAMENKQTGLRPLEMHPVCLRHLSTGKRLTKFSVALWLPTNFVRLPPRRGRFTLRSASELISISRHNAAKSSPSGGKVVR